MADSISATRKALIEKIARTVNGAARQQFLRDYYYGVADEDLAERVPASLAASALSHWQQARHRLRHRTSVVVAASATYPGKDSGRTAVTIVCDDMPFLVDSINMVFASLGIGVHLVIHPVFNVQRQRGMLRAAVAMHHGKAATHSPAESWQLYEIDRQDDPAAQQTLIARLQRSLNDVRAAVADWLPMRAQVRALAQQVKEHPPRGVAAADVREAQSFLEWIEAQHFTFLGYRYYQLRRGQRQDQLVPVAATGLGILRVRGKRAAAALQPNILRGAARERARDQSVLVLTKADAVSTVHRAAYLDYVAIKEFAADGRPCGEHRFLGLWTSTAYFASPRDIPVLRQKVAQIVKHFGLDPRSHDGKSVLAVLETYPRDELFQASVAELVEIARGVVNLYERRTVRMMSRRDPFGRYWSIMVYVPRDRYSTVVRERIEHIVATGFHGARGDSQVQISDSSHARVHVIVRTNPDSRLLPDQAAIESAISDATTTWAERLRDALLQTTTSAQANALAARYQSSFPSAYCDEVPPDEALEDIRDLEALQNAPGALRLNLRSTAAPRNKSEPARATLKIIRRGEPIPISDLLPLMENFNLRVLSERPYVTTHGSIQEFEFEQRGGVAIDTAAVESRFNAAFLAAWNGQIENDGFNKLLLLSPLDAREISVLRAYGRYLLQTGLPFRQTSIERALAANAGVAAKLLALFRSLLQPAASTNKSSAASTNRLRKAIQSALDAVSSADEDRILRAYLAVIEATLRTNYWQRGADGAPAEYLSFKFDPERVPDLPLPRPKFEIFVYSPRVEGVHLRKGLVARGGIRWSDRRDDFRTEVLGLMKAQHVKNTLIVPVGAKGGFFPKRLPAGGSRDDVQREGTAAYQVFINALLDITDNIVDGKIRAPRDVRRRDGDDPYLVVAADKGTATFSDTANVISIQHHHWLGDAFASGGSAGYDHKKMGITARGAWECVKRHFREAGLDIQSQDYSAVGIGDMSGDVFGNGMLLSRHTRLIAAFNHLHIFIDPEPDVARSFAERERLFALPRSGWDDYNKKLIARGGGIYPRTAKSIALSNEAQRVLDISTATLTPNDLIRAILRAPVDLLWNGGIGTYCKSSQESHTDAGDRSNDAVRVDARELRARVVGEGGNLGFTQRGRVEYALAGGRINTDFIDNSAGVNTSDVEVNLKILLNAEELAGRLKRPARNRLLASMTNEVAALVLRNNYLQGQAISTLELQSTRRLQELQHLVRRLERSGDLNRGIEFLPDEEGFVERRKAGLGLTRPELAVLLSYSKIWLNNQLLDSDVPEDRYLSAELERYFPAAIQQRFARAIGAHRLRREIIATAVTNSLINRMGPTFVARAHDDTGANAGEIARAYSIAREAFDMRTFWRDVEALDNHVIAAIQYSALSESARLLRHASYWLLQHRRGALDVERTIKQFAGGLRDLVAQGESLLLGSEREAFETAKQAQLAAGVPAQLAVRIAAQGPLNNAFDIVDIANRVRAPVLDSARIYGTVGVATGIDWLRSRILNLSVDGSWQATARTGLQDAAAQIQRELTQAVLTHKARGSAASRVAHWLASRGERAQQWQRALSDLRAAGATDFATLSVGVEAVRKLVRA